MAYTSEITNEQKFKIFAPFFESVRADSSDKHVDYDCLFCNNPVLPKSTGARSFSGTSIVWAHVPCLEVVPEAHITYDAKMKHKLHAALKEKQALARKEANKNKAPENHICASADESEIRLTVEAEYEARMQRAIEVIQMLQGQIAEKDRQLAILTAPVGVAMAEKDALKRAAQQDVAPEEKADSKASVKRCGYARKDGSPCAWNVGKSPCPHHKAHASDTAVVKAMSDPKNEVHIDVVKAESKPVEKTQIRPEDGTYTVTFYELAQGDSLARLGKPGVMEGKYMPYVSYLFADSSLVKTFKSIPKESLVTVDIRRAKIENVTVEKAPESKGKRGKAA